MKPRVQGFVRLLLLGWLICTPGKLQAASAAPVPKTTFGPVSVILTGFEARLANGQVEVYWETADETNCVGFYLYRADNFGDLVLISGGLIACENFGSPGGREYSFVDSDVHPGNLYEYYLDDLDSGGVISRSGPASVMYATNWLYLPMVSR